MYLEVLQVRRAQVFGAQGHSGHATFPNVIRLVGSGRVRFFGLSDYRWDPSNGHTIVSRLTGDQTHVRVRRKLVDATYLEGEIPSRHALPFETGGIRLEASEPGFVRMRVAGSSAEVPRHWAARFFFRWALHDYRLGYVETYGGLYTDDRGEDAIIGLRGGDSVSIHKDELTPIVEALYRAIAPPGYTEELLP